MNFKEESIISYDFTIQKKLLNTTLKLLLDTVHEIYSNKELTNDYLIEIEKMNPHVDYDKLSKETITYLFLLLSNHYSYLVKGIVLTSEKCIKLESMVYKKLDEL